MPSANYELFFAGNLRLYWNLINPERQVGIGFCDPGFALGLPTTASTPEFRSRRGTYAPNWQEAEYILDCGAEAYTRHPRQYRGCGHRSGTRANAWSFAECTT